MVLSAVSSPICTVDIVRSKLTGPIEFSINVVSSRSSFIKLESALDFTLFHNGSRAEDQNARKSLGSCRTSQCQGSPHSFCLEGTAEPVGSWSGLAESGIGHGVLQIST